MNYQLDEPRENWGFIPDYPDYIATRDGQIYSARRKSLSLMQGAKSKHGGGMHTFTLTKPNGDKRKMTKFHLVALTFVSLPPSPQHYARPINGDVFDIRPENIEWTTTMMLDIGSTHYKSKVDATTVIEIRKRHAKGESTHSIAESLGLSKNIVNPIVKFKSWKFNERELRKIAENERWKNTPMIWDGIEYPSIEIAAKAIGISPQSMYYRFRKGYKCDADITTQARKTKQTLILEFINGFYLANGMPPTLDKICKGVKMSLQTVRTKIKKLVAQKKLFHDPQKGKYYPYLGSNDRAA